MWLSVPRRLWLILDWRAPRHSSLHEIAASIPPTFPPRRTNARRQQHDRILLGRLPLLLTLPRVGAHRLRSVPICGSGQRERAGQSRRTMEALLHPGEGCTAPCGCEARFPAAGHRHPYGSATAPGKSGFLGTGNPRVCNRDLCGSISPEAKAVRPRVKSRHRLQQDSLFCVRRFSYSSASPTLAAMRLASMVLSVNPSSRFSPS